MKIPMKAGRSKIAHWIVTRKDSVATQSWRVDFIPVANVPGWTHRVAINNKLTRSYLAEGHKPNKSSAIYFAEKHEDMAETAINNT